MKAGTATLAGAGLVALHAAGFLALAARSGGTDLAVTLDAPLAAETLALDGTVPAGIRDRVTVRTTGTGPGLVRRTWSVDYRGGFTRSVGAAQLVGPFQDPDGHACVGRIVVGQSLLDDGTGKPGTIAYVVGLALDDELRGTSIVGLGDYQRIEKLSLAWARLGANPVDLPLVGGAPEYIRVTLTLVFERVNVPIVVALVPRPDIFKLDFTIAARAELDFENRVVQWLSDRFNGDAIATRFATREIDAAVVAALEPPPPLELGNGATLRFTYCNGPFELEAGAWGALPFGVHIDRVAAAPLVRPPRHGPGPRPAVAPGTKLAVDLDLDALNAMLYETWRAGYLDQQLAAAGLDERFNTDPIVTEYLSLRISRPVLALPPVLAVNGAGLQLAADARVTVADGALTTVGRVWGAIDLKVSGATLAPAIPADLAELELACTRGPALVPCYADLVAAVRARAADFHAPLTAVTALLLAQFTDQRVGDPSVPGELVVHGVRPSLATSGTNATLRLEAMSEMRVTTRP